MYDCGLSATIILGQMVECFAFVVIMRNFVEFLRILSKVLFNMCWIFFEELKKLSIINRKSLLHYFFFAIDCLKLVLYQTV